MLKTKVGSNTVESVLNTLRDGKLQIVNARKLFNILGDYLSDSFLRKLLDRFGSDLQHIIDNAPPIKKLMVLYRGVKTDYYLKGKEGHYYKSDGFVSTSVSVSKATGFTNKLITTNPPHCCMKRVTLLPGTKALVIMGVSHYPDEKEVLLGLNTKYLVRKAKQRKKFYDNSVPSQFCFNKQASTEFYTSDIVVVE
jgi:hypothetical protein